MRDLHNISGSKSTSQKSSSVLQTFGNPIKFIINNRSDGELSRGE